MWLNNRVAKVITWIRMSSTMDPPLSILANSKTYKEHLVTRYIQILAYLLTLIPKEILKGCIQILAYLPTLIPKAIL